MMADPFDLLERIGRGGMGVVWKARDRSTGQVVAIKLLHSVYAEEPEYLARFEREVEIARRIDSPHVVKVLGYGQREGAPYMVMEYVEGPSLRQHLKERGKLSWEEAKPILRQVAEGLGAAHAVGVIHRDVKPSNILIAADGTAKLADFGIARATDLTALTGGSTMLGTPHYMAPEGKASVQSDVYALGCVAYEMLAGSPPFEGDSQQEVIAAHIGRAVDLDRVPVAARPLIAACLEKDPARRPQSAAAVLAGIDAPGSLPPVTSRRIEPREPTSAGRPLVRRPVLVATAVALAVGALVAVALGSALGSDGGATVSPPPATDTPGTRPAPGSAGPPGPTPVSIVFDEKVQVPPQPYEPIVTFGPFRYTGRILDITVHVDFRCEPGETTYKWFSDVSSPDVHLLTESGKTISANAGTGISVRDERIPCSAREDGSMRFDLARADGPPVSLWYWGPRAVVDIPHPDSLPRPAAATAPTVQSSSTAATQAPR